MFGPLEFSRRDLMAVNIQRGRDHGLPDYNTVRQHYGLARKPNFDSIVDADLTADPDVTRQVKPKYIILFFCGCCKLAAERGENCSFGITEINDDACEVQQH